jgi:hypothetical protein
VDNDGNPFRSDIELKEYVRNFYQKIYKAPASDDTIREDCIRKFLEEEICNSNLVKDSIIPENLAQELEDPFTLTELDESAAQGNRSAAGMDSINNCFFKKILASSQATIA